MTRPRFSAVVLRSACFALLWLLVVDGFTPVTAQAARPAASRPAGSVAAVGGQIGGLLGEAGLSQGQARLVPTKQNRTLLARIAALQAQTRSPLGANTSASVFGQPYVNTTGHQVYFHYQLAGHEYGTIPSGGYSSQAAYLQDITEAASLGADGFSIDVQSLDQGNQDELTRFYAAANQYNTLHPAPSGSDGAGAVNPAFTLFITLDCSTPGIEAPTPLATVFLRFALDPAYTRVKDAAGNLRPRFSTYAGAGGTGWADCRKLWNITLADIRAGRINPFFVPGFEQDPQVPGGPAPTDAQWIQGLLVGLADGCWEFANNYPPLGIAPGPSPIPGEEAKSAAVQAAGLYREASIRNQAWASGSNTPRFYNEYCGGEGLDAWWTSVITVQNPRSVQILTWNDYDETSWTTNADEGPSGAWPYLYHSSVSGFYPSRLGLQADYKYYIQWYKTGQKPTIANDMLVAMYRVQTAAASTHPTADPLGGIVYSIDDTGGGPNMSHAPDVIWLDCFLTQSATIILTQDGGYAVQRNVPAGHSHLRLPFRAGSVTLSAVRDGQTALTLTGRTIAGSGALANANYYTGTAHN